MVNVPIGIPTDIPPVDFGEQFDPRDFSGVGVEGGVFDGVKGGTGSVDASSLFRAATVDERPERLSGPPLQYPAALREAGISGFVVIEFVINTTGRVDPSSIRIVRSSNAAFEGPARDAIRKSLFRPGRVRGMAVRVLVQLQMDFNFVAGR
ncbi:MAG: energy transducer TonB [Gemmatimonadetes bacterium]|nr:energy transducer TonB [Gemmatimonadota bacterium]